MIPIEPTQKINVEAMYSMLMQRKHTVTRFRLPYTATQVYTMLYTACRVEVEYRHRKYVDNEAYNKHLMQIAEWLTSSSSSSFGLFLCGGAGNGKTTITRALRNLITSLRSTTTKKEANTGFSIVPAKDIVLLAKAYNNPSRDNAENVAMYKRLRNIEILAIDDLGTEPRESMHYGDYVTAVIDIISYRYEEQLCTIATSNLAPTEISSYYDERIADRFREMMCIVNFGNNKSFRT